MHLYYYKSGKYKESFNDKAKNIVLIGSIKFELFYGVKLYVFNGNNFHGKAKNQARIHRITSTHRQQQRGSMSIEVHNNVIISK